MNVAKTKEASFMSFKRNIPGWERAVRAGLGIGLLAGGTLAHALPSLRLADR